MQNLRCENKAMSLIYDLEEIIVHKIALAEAKGDREPEGVPLAWALKNYIDFYLNIHYQPVSDRSKT